MYNLLISFLCSTLVSVGLVQFAGQGLWVGVIA